VLNPGTAEANENLYASSGTITVNSVGATDVHAPASINDGLYDGETGTAVWNNLAGGVFTLHDSASILGDAGSVFTNAAGATFAHAGAATGLVQWGFANAGTVEVQAGGTLAFEGAVAQDDGAGTLTGGTWIVDSNATLVFSGNPAFTTIASGATVTLNGANSTFIAIDSLTTNDGTFQLLAGRAFSVAGNLTNAGTVTVDGAGSTLNVGGTLAVGCFGKGTLTLTNGGTVNIGGINLSNGAVNVGVGGVLSGTGTVNGNVIFGAGGIITSGFQGGGNERITTAIAGEGLTAPATLTLNGNVTLSGGAILNFNLGAGSDPLNLTGGTLTGPDSGVVTVNITGQDGFGGGDYALLDFVSGSAVDLTAGDFTVGAAPDGYAYAFAVTDDSVMLDISAVPEPSTYAVWLGLGVLGLAALRRRAAKRS
jgi:fibronectin-binding autotransporter adhesin